MAEEDISQEFSLNKIENIHTYLIKEIDKNGLIGKKRKKIIRTLN